MLLRAFLLELNFLNRSRSFARRFHHAKEGDGLAFVHSGGTMAKKELKSWKVLKVDTGCIIGFTRCGL
jgi:hypothetical protein